VFVWESWQLELDGFDVGSKCKGTIVCFSCKSFLTQTTKERIVFGAPVSELLKKPSHNVVRLVCRADDTEVPHGPQAFLFAGGKWRCLFNGDGHIVLHLDVLRQFHEKHKDWIGPKMDIYMGMLCLYYVLCFALFIVLNCYFCGAPVVPFAKCLDYAWLGSDVDFVKEKVNLFAVPVVGASGSSDGFASVRNLYDELAIGTLQRMKSKT
jgi:hypothetical protein